MSEEADYRLTDAQLKDREICRETAKRLCHDGADDPEMHSYGVALMERAAAMGDPEAAYYLGYWLVVGFLKPKTGDPMEAGLELVCAAANSGVPAARAFLNRFTDMRYDREVQRQMEADGYEGPLRDFDGNVIRIRHTGLLTPIDATLEYIDGKNILTFRVNIPPLYEEGTLPDPEAFYQAVFRGILAWQGEYNVFGNQNVQVRIELTAEYRLFDSVLVFPLTPDIRETAAGIWDRVGTKKVKTRMNDIIKNKRSFALAGVRKWSVRSRKIIYIQSKDDRFDDYEEIMHVAKHEFGHALGLGDLYYSPVDQLEGVSKGQYRELDSYYIKEKRYNLVMCDHHGPISNNDIEMVILAFRENRMQMYQASSLKGKISDALGKGN